MNFLKFSSEQWRRILLNYKKCSTCPRWHQADFLWVGCTLPEYAKKHLLCPKMRSCAISSRLTCPGWHQADFSWVGCTLPEYAKKHLLCPKMRSCAISSRLKCLLLLSVQNECEIGLETCHNDPLGIAECVDLEINYMCRCQHFVEYGFTWSIIQNECQIKDSGDYFSQTLLLNSCMVMKITGKFLNGFAKLIYFSHCTTTWFRLFPSNTMQALEIICLWWVVGTHTYQHNPH